MSTDRTTLTVSGISVEVVRKPIKNLHLAVYPPDGWVRVASPEHFDDDAIRLAVVDRLGWIRRQQDELLSQPRQSEREMVTGESHYVWGRRYRLRVVEDASEANDVRLLDGKTLQLTVMPGADRARREAVLTEWYRGQMKSAVPPIVERWQDRLDVTVRDWRVRRMRTKWGTCNAEAGRIWLNLHLALKPPGCLEYVAVHEMIHLREPGHSERFTELLDEVMPRWRHHRDELTRYPLSSEDWQHGRSDQER